MPTSYFRCIRKNKGFTLLEISIVLVVVGLIVGGIFTSRTMIEVFQARKLMSQMEEIQTAVITFKLKYGCIPGDCAATPDADFALGTNGNGDGFVGSVSSVYTAQGGCLTGPSTSVCITQGEYSGGHTGFQIYPLWGEDQWFWVHLSASNLIRNSFTTLASAATSITLDPYFPRDANNRANLIVFTWNNKLYIRTGFTTLLTGPTNAASWAPFTVSQSTARRCFISTINLILRQILMSAYHRRIIPLSCVVNIGSCPLICVMLRVLSAPMPIKFLSMLQRVIHQQHSHITPVIITAVQ